MLSLLVTLDWLICILADLGGVPGARLPLRVQIPSFQHTKFSTITPWEFMPPYEVYPPPHTRNPGSATVVGQPRIKDGVQE